MARVTGVGGVFLRSSDPKRLSAWYAEHLGVQLNDWGGASFEWKDEVPAGTGVTAWSAFPQDTKYFGDGEQTAMINYRVDDLAGLLETLTAAGVWIDPKRDDADYGRFAWIKDCDGNRVELWEPLAQSDEKKEEFLG
ncbi:MAG TPA: VOC family protein [Acidobacteriaceae bacterium]|jgi:predicted enzyme related to lactoylglutathione lyase